MSKKTSQLPAASECFATDLFPASQENGGDYISRKVTGSQVATRVAEELSIGTMAVQDATNVNISGGSITGITDLAVSDGGTGASDAATARTNLGLGSISIQDAGNVNITGGVINGFVGISSTYIIELIRTLAAAVQIGCYNLNDSSSNAHAQIMIVCGGESGGDAMATFSINGGELFSIGLDNSDSNAFVISKSGALGTNNVFRIGQDGTPSFSSAPLGLSSGGTGGTDAATARGSLGAAASGANTDINTIRLANTGLAIRDASGNQIVRIVPGSTTTATRVFTLTTGDVNRTLDISAADVTISSFIATLLDDTSASAARTTLGLGTAATLASSAVAQTANNLSDLASAASARTNLGLTATATISGTSYTFVIGDAFVYNLTSSASAVTVTVPPNSSVAFPTGTVLYVQQGAAGQVTIAPGSGVTINNEISGFKSFANGTLLTLVKTATDTWTLLGNTVA